MTEQELIGTYLELNPNKPSLAEAVVKDALIAVWALVATLPAVDGDIDKLADQFEVPREAAEAALAYYRRHQWLIDARLDANKVAEWPHAAVPAGV